jgi:hypothetical protein
MNEIQIIRQQLAMERLHFAEVAQACVAALDSGKFVAGSQFVAASADYLAFASTRLTNAPSLQVPAANAPAERWNEFLTAFTAHARKQFETLDELAARNPLVTEWRAVSRIDADSIFSERARYERFKAAVT